MDCLCDSSALRSWVGNGVSLLIVSNVLMCVGHLIRTDHWLGLFSQIGTGSVTNLFVTGARDRENARDQVAPTSHMTVGTHVTYHVTSGPLGYHVTYHVTHHVIQLA